MSNFQPLSDLFFISGGNQLSKSQLTTPGDNPIAYISRTHRRNGLDGWSGPIKGVDPAPAGCITVCLRSRNHTLSSFVQPYPFYTTFHVAVLRPRKEMTLAEKIWWCKCIELNRFRFNFGRQANRTLGELLVPAGVPPFVENASVPTVEKGAGAELVIDTSTWQPIKLETVFDLLPGRRDGRGRLPKGTVPWVSSSAESNGISAHVDAKPDFNAGCITVANNGSIGATFYQPDAFIASTDVTILRPKTVLSTPVALFLCSVLRRESFKYNYARKWTMQRMKATVLQLPMDKSGLLDIVAIEKIVRHSAFSKLLELA